MVAELLRDPAGASRDTVTIEGHGDGLPDLADARLIAALQGRGEQGVGPKGSDAAAPRSRCADQPGASNSAGRQHDESPVMKAAHPHDPTVGIFPATENRDRDTRARTALLS